MPLVDTCVFNTVVRVGTMVAHDSSTRVADLALQHLNQPNSSPQDFGQTETSASAARPQLLDRTYIHNGLLSILSNGLKSDFGDGRYRRLRRRPASPPTNLVSPQSAALKTRVKERLHVSRRHVHGLCLDIRHIQYSTHHAP